MISLEYLRDTNENLVSTRGGQTTLIAPVDEIFSTDIAGTSASIPCKNNICLAGTEVERYSAPVWWSLEWGWKHQASFGSQALGIRICEAHVEVEWRFPPESVQVHQMVERTVYVNLSKSLDSADF